MEEAFFIAKLYLIFDVLNCCINNRQSWIIQLIMTSHLKENSWLKYNPEQGSPCSFILETFQEARLFMGFSFYCYALRIQIIFLEQLLLGFGTVFSLIEILAKMIWNVVHKEITDWSMKEDNRKMNTYTLDNSIGSGNSWFPAR